MIKYRKVQDQRGLYVALRWLLMSLKVESTQNVCLSNPETKKVRVIIIIISRCVVFCVLGFGFCVSGS